MVRNVDAILNPADDLKSILQGRDERPIRLVKRGKSEDFQEYVAQERNSLSLSR